LAERPLPSMESPGPCWLSDTVISYANGWESPLCPRRLSMSGAVQALLPELPTSYFSTTVVTIGFQGKTQIGLESQAYSFIPESYPLTDPG
jgi:hypothetical protein